MEGEGLGEGAGVGEGVLLGDGDGLGEGDGVGEGVDVTEPPPEELEDEPPLEPPEPPDEQEALVIVTVTLGPFKAGTTTSEYASAQVVGIFAVLVRLCLLVARNVTDSDPERVTVTLSPLIVNVSYVDPAKRLNAPLLVVGVSVTSTLVV